MNINTSINETLLSWVNGQYRQLRNWEAFYANGYAPLFQRIAEDALAVSQTFDIEQVSGIWLDIRYGKLLQMPRIPDCTDDKYRRIIKAKMLQSNIGRHSDFGATRNDCIEIVKLLAFDSEHVSLFDHNWLVFTELHHDYNGYMRGVISEIMYQTVHCAVQHVVAEVPCVQIDIMYDRLTEYNNDLFKLSYYDMTTLNEITEYLTIAEIENRTDIVRTSKILSDSSYFNIRFFLNSGVYADIFTYNRRYSNVTIRRQHNDDEGLIITENNLQMVQTAKSEDQFAIIPQFSFDDSIEFMGIYTI